ncbi:energy-coupling factor transporter ATP-binding protein EcfA2 [Variovorax boronicumulans]|uniref:AAA family ATPase n=1 Tax=Variovorax boronicumulans TaxID=436515 RepID=UPI002780DB15|nr:AAA family ATPase [Variovorax boronicumulans]MDQ0034421.1 energy-coupling factor transporter ATP-binding protein EcfA2 [Variovorax boronicumulans]
MTLHIDSLETKDGGQINLGSLTALVGPNNSGKSLTLRDMREYLTTGKSEKLKTITKLKVKMLDWQQAEAQITRKPHPSSIHHQEISGVSFDLLKGYKSSIALAWTESIPYKSIDTLHVSEEALQNFGMFWVAHLDAEGRFRLAAPTDAYDVRDEIPSNALQAFFALGEPALSDLRQAFLNAFKIDIALDWAAMKKWRLVVGEDFGHLPNDRDSLDLLLRTATSLSDQGDGYRSFAGVVLSVLTFPNRILLLDEPEAFLHPAQARILGRWLAKHCKTRNAQVIVSSHSADFLAGIISEDGNASVIRLNRWDGLSRYHQVPSDTTAALIRSPLLSSQPVMDALFHTGVVVCEGDPDRAIYQTVAHTFLEAEDVLFIHSNGKNAAKSPVELLRSAGTPVCAILDIDALNSPDVLNDICLGLTGQKLPEDLQISRARIASKVGEIEELPGIEMLREAVATWLKSDHRDLRQTRKSLEQLARTGAKWDEVKKLGVDFFDQEGKKDVLNFLGELAALGIFIVPCGELESWIPLSRKKGRHWNAEALTQLRDGKCPGDLKDFVQGVLQKLAKEQKRNLPFLENNPGS